MILFRQRIHLEWESALVTFLPASCARLLESLQVQGGHCFTFLVTHFSPFSAVSLGFVFIRAV